MPKDHNILRALSCNADLEAIFDHLFNAYVELGDLPDDALSRAARRVRGIEDDLETLGDVPLQGTRVPRIMDGLRYVAKDNAVFYFTVNESACELRILGVFFGGQDHQKHILKRISGTKDT